MRLTGKRRVREVKAMKSSRLGKDSSPKETRATVQNQQRRRYIPNLSSDESIEIARDVGPEKENIEPSWHIDKMVYNSTPVALKGKGIRDWSLLPRLSSIERDVSSERSSKGPLFRLPRDRELRSLYNARHRAQGSADVSAATAGAQWKSQKIGDFVGLQKYKSTKSSNNAAPARRTPALAVGTPEQIAIRRDSDKTIVLNGTDGGTVYITFSPEERSSSRREQPCTSHTRVVISNHRSLSSLPSDELSPPGWVAAARHPSPPLPTGWCPQHEPKESADKLTNIDELTETASMPSLVRADRRKLTSIASGQTKREVGNLSRRCHTVCESHHSSTGSKSRSDMAAAAASAAEECTALAAHSSRHSTTKKSLVHSKKDVLNKRSTVDVKAGPKTTSTPKSSSAPTFSERLNVSAIDEPEEDSMLYPHSSREVNSDEVFLWNDEELATWKEPAPTLPPAMVEPNMQVSPRLGERTADCCCSCHVSGAKVSGRRKVTVADIKKTYHPEYLRQYGNIPVDPLLFP